MPIYEQVMAFKYPAYREHVKQLKSMPAGGERWTRWKKAMIPKRNVRGYTNRAKKHVGSRRVGLEKRIPESCGIYEWKVVKKKVQNVVYVGSTCNKNKVRLKTRIGQYCDNGSHKADVINLALKDGFELQVRFKKYKSMEDSEKAENFLLARYNYAWNVRRNGVRRPLERNG